MLESMACGTPVVATDTVGGLEVRENFPDDVTVVPRADSEQLAKAVSQSLISRRRVSPAALLHVTRDFTAAACAAQYLRVYQGALSSRR